MPRNQASNVTQKQFVRNSKDSFESTVYENRKVLHMLVIETVN